MRRTGAIGKGLSGAWTVLALLALCAAPLRALESRSTSYRNTRSALGVTGSGGGSNNGEIATMVAAGFTNLSTVGEVAGATSTANSFVSTNYTQRAGLPSVYEFPGTVTGFWASSGPAIGSIYLQWTAPGNDAYAAATKAKDFVIAYSTVASLSPAVSTTNWYAALAGGGFVGSVPAPQYEGTLQTMVVNGLTPGVTYYFAIEGQEADGLYGPLSKGATAVATIGITPITDLVASTTTTLGDIKLTWTAPSYFGSNPPLAYTIKASTVANMNNQADFNNAQLLSIFSTSTIPTPLTGGATQSMLVTGLKPCVAYYFAISEGDNGNPPSQSQWSRSLSSAPPAINYFNFNTPGCSAPLVPMEPLNIALSTGMTIQSLAAHAAKPNVLVLVATVSWSPVTAYYNGVPFANPNSPSSSELLDYRVQYTSAPVPTPEFFGYSWTDLPGMPLPPSQLSYMDANMGANCLSGCLYRVIAENCAVVANGQCTGQSLSSNMRATTTNNLWAVFTDTAAGQVGAATMEVPQSFANGLTNYYVSGKVHPEDYSLSGRGPVIQSIEFDALQNGMTLNSQLRLSGAANLIVYYPVDANGHALSPAEARAGGVPQAASSSSNNQLSMFWNDGNAWIQAYGKVQVSNLPASNNMGMAYLQTAFLGRYQLRSAELPGGFTFDSSGLTNRFITPNGDGKNDNAIFNFANPQFSNVTGKIFDMKGRFVADMATPPASFCANGAPGQCLMWAPGSGIAGGVYVYQISGEGHSFNGTIVVIK